MAMTLSGRDCRIMVARVATTSKCREKPKEAVLDEESKDMPLPYVLLYPPLSPAPSSVPLSLTLDAEARGMSTPIKSGPEALEASTSQLPWVLWILSPLQVHQFSPYTPHSIGGT
jgi:hypothetical protein